MESNLSMNFSIGKENKMVNIKREFDAPLSDVWSAWTEAEVLDLWWAPLPFKSETKIMEFKEGGRRLYAMVGPEDQKRWSTFDYSSISPKTNFKYAATFSDSEGNPNSEFGSSYWDINFTEKGERTIVDIAITRDSLEDLLKIVEMGFKEGMTATMKTLDTILKIERNKINVELKS